MHLLVNLRTFLFTKKEESQLGGGGALCVQLANITVCYIINKAVYSKPQLMHNVREASHYIDAHNPYGLYIDESVIKEVNGFVPLLDIQFCFDCHSKLQTNLYVKPTMLRHILISAVISESYIFRNCLFPMSTITSNNQ